MSKPIKNPRFVYQLETIKPSLDLRNTEYVTIGMFDKPDLLRLRVTVLTKCPAFRKASAWQPGKNDNESVVRHGNMFYRMTRHALQLSYR
jgi:hypothetical protein